MLKIVFSFYTILRHATSSQKLLKSYICKYIFFSLHSELCWVHWLAKRKFIFPQILFLLSSDLLPAGDGSTRPRVHIPAQTYR